MEEYSLVEAAREADISLMEIINSVNEGQIKCRNENNQIFIPQESLNHYLSGKETQLTVKQKAIFDYLIGESILLNIEVPEEIGKSPTLVADRLEEVITTIERNGEVLIPPRPIKEIRWQPELEVDYSRRKFDGNPLAVFKKYIDIYQGLSRKDMETFDLGLLRSLIRHNQIDEAIPILSAFSRSKPRELTPFQQDKLLSLYKKHHGCVTYIIKDSDFPICKDTVLRFLRQKGLKTRTKRGPVAFVDSDREKFEELHESSGGNAYKACRASDYSHKTIAKAWKEIGLEVRHKGYQTGTMLKQERIDMIRDVFAECKSVPQTAIITGHCERTVRKYMSLKSV